MNLSEMKDEIVRRTGVPRMVVSLILDAQEDILSECVMNRETCYIGNMFTVRSRFRDFSVILKGEREIVNRLAVYVKPRAPFRRKLNGKVRSTN